MQGPALEACSWQVTQEPWGPGSAPHSLCTSLIESTHPTKPLMMGGRRFPTSGTWSGPHLGF